MTNKKIEEYKDRVLADYMSMVLGRLISNNLFHIALESEHLKDLLNKYRDDITIKELGKSTTLVEIPELDTEFLYIGGNEKWRRVGVVFQYSTCNSRPLELARERVQDRLNLLSTDLVLKISNDEYYDGDEPADYISIGGDGYFEAGYLNYYPQAMSEGMSMLNRNKKHNAWVFHNSIQRTVSLDKELFDMLVECGLKTNTCIGCGAILGGEHLNLCPLCKHKYAECRDCGKLTNIDDGKFSNSKFFCNECLAKPRCRGCGYPIKDGDGVLCERCNSIRGVLDYHSGLGRQDESGNARFKVGLEVEKMDTLKMTSKEILRLTGWVAERDASLGAEGFELVSPVYPLDLRWIAMRVEPIKKVLGATVNEKCGGHIHVSDTQRTPYEILLDIRGYLPLLYGLYPYRATNEYCEAKEMSSYADRGHRQALNITSKTLEFRIFPAVKDVAQMLFRLSLVEYMIKNKQTDVVKVGELLLDEESDLYKLLNTRITKTELKKKAEAFIDFTNYLERDALVIEDKKIRRVINVPKIKQEKDKATEDRLKKMSEDYKRMRTSEDEAYNNNIPRPITERDYGYFATQIEGYQSNTELPF